MEKFASDLEIFFGAEYFGTIHPGRKEQTFTGHLSDATCQMSESLHRFTHQILKKNPKQTDHPPPPPIEPKRKPMRGSDIKIRN